MAADAREDVPKELSVGAPDRDAPKQLVVLLDRPTAPCAQPGAVLPVGSLRFAAYPGTGAHELLAAITQAFGLRTAEAAAAEGSENALCLVHVKTEQKVEPLDYEHLEDGSVYILRLVGADVPRHLVEGLWFGAVQAGSLAASGARSFALTPARRLAQGQGALAAAAGVRAGAWDLTCGVVGGVGDLLSCTLEGARNTPDALLGRESQAPLLQSNLRAGERAPQHMVAGLVVGVGAFGRTVLDGVHELAVEPARKAKEDGVEGALKALGRSAASAPGQLVVGTLDTMQSLTTGLLNTPGTVSRGWSAACGWLEGRILGPPFFARGPICQFDKPYGWGAGRSLAVPGWGTQSWLFCPLISLGLAEAERALGCGVWSCGAREPVPAKQAAYWQQQAGHIVRAYATWFQWNFSSGIVAEILHSRARWRTGGDDAPADHLSGEDQELVTPAPVWQALAELLAELSEWQPPERIMQPPDAGLTCDLGHKIAPAEAAEHRTICFACYGSIPEGAQSRRCSAGCVYSLCSVCSSGPALELRDAAGPGPSQPTTWTRFRKTVEDIWNDW